MSSNLKIAPVSWMAPIPTGQVQEALIMDRTMADQKLSEDDLAQYGTVERIPALWAGDRGGGGYRLSMTDTDKKNTFLAHMRSLIPGEWD